MMTQTPQFATAETDFRLARARAQYPRPTPASRRRHFVPRRPSLQLPRPLRRPVVVG
jgi:hypothetical protein